MNTARIEVLHAVRTAGELASTMRLYVYDSAAEACTTIPPPPGREDVYDDSSTALGRNLFVYGGQRWAGDGLNGDGEAKRTDMPRSAPYEDLTAASRYLR